jgi:PPM family protein phosphatase
VQVTVHVCTHRSRSHQVNQDRAVVGREVVASAREVERVSLDTPTLLAVLDGLGGHAAGEVASELAARTIASAPTPLDEDATARLLHEANAVIFAAVDGDDDRIGMGTTAAVLAVDGDGNAMVGNVGDSSVWRVRDGELDLLSIPDRVRGGILQCLGGHAGSGIEPHVRLLELAPGDRLLLASDGLTDVLPTASIADALREDAGPAAMHLLESVIATGPPDDVTIMVVDVDA